MDNNIIQELRDYMLNYSDKPLDESKIHSILNVLLGKMSRGKVLEIDEYFFLILSFYKKIVDMRDDYVERSWLGAEDLPNDEPYCESARYKKVARKAAYNASDIYDDYYILHRVGSLGATTMMKEQLSSVKTAYERTRKELE